MASSTTDGGTTTTFGATIVPTSSPPTNPRTHLLGLDSPVVTPSPSHEDLTISPTATRSLPPYSPFYEHDRPPLDRAASRDSFKNRPMVTEKGIEEGFVPRDPENPFGSKIRVGASSSGKEDGMWPSKQTLLLGRQAEKKRKRDRKACGGCGPLVEFWARRSKKEKILCQVAIAVVVLGLVVTIGLCISIAVHGSVYEKPGQQQDIDIGQ